MGLRKQKNSSKAIEQRIAQKVSILDRDELFQYIDVTLSNICQYIPAYRSGRNPEQLTEAVTSTSVLYTLLFELQSRAEASEQRTRQVMG